MKTKGWQMSAAALCALLMLGPGISVSNADVIPPNDIVGPMDGSTVSSPITFENFVAQSMAVPGYTSVQFKLTIQDQCNGCSGSMDMAEIYYGPLTANKTHVGSMTDTEIVTAFNAPCTFPVTIGPTSNPYPTVNCTLSTTEADPQSTGSFLYDLENGGLSIVVACVQQGQPGQVVTYTSGQCKGGTNLNDTFFFSGAAGDPTNSSMTLLPQTISSTPEPSAILLVTAVVGLLKLFHRVGKSYSFKRSPVVRG
jgi:hypothetical protein